MIGPGMYS
jgi:DnaJ family protein A protein 2